MKRALLVIILVLAALSALAAERPEYLLRVERAGDYNRQELLASKYDLAADLGSCLLVRGAKADVIKLQAAGYAVTILDSDPLGWDYYQVGLRPDSDKEALAAVGTVIHTEENWVILRTVPGTQLDRLLEAKVFIGPIGREPLKEALYPNELLSRRPEGRLSVVPLVQQMVNSVVNADIMNYWTTLTANAPTGTRYSTNKGCGDAAAYVYNTYAGLGIPASYQTWNASHAPNIIGTMTGAVSPAKVYILINHLDDLPASGLAPGADDNGSGSVTNLELAKIMSCYAFKNTVKLIACTGEEAGLLGSEAYAADARARGENIQGVISFDMPGWAGDGLPATGENLDLNYNTGVPGSQALGELFAACATDYGTGLPVDAFNCPALNASDHYPFWTRGWAAICAITDNEGYCGHEGNYPYYHTLNDTIANCGNPAFFYSAVRATLATLAELGEPFKITLDKTAYACGGNVQIIVGDRDLNTNPSTAQAVNILIWSTAETTPETVILTEDGVNSMIFKGTIPITTAAPVHGDGLLSVAAGSTITASYTDAVDCNGATNVVYTDSAPACTPPVISNVLISGVNPTSAVVSWTTNVPTNSRVTYGTTTPPGTNNDHLASYSTSHSVTLSGLAQCTKYYLSVTSADVAGNSATDNNTGIYYSFTTLGARYAMGPDTVEGGVLSWVVSPASGADIWHQDTCRAASGSHSWKVGKSDAPTCTAQYASSLSNYYLTWNANINLGVAGHGYHLRFNEWYDSESNTGCTYDPLRTQISTDGGTTWVTLATNCGASGGWVARDYDLAAYTGTQVRIRFYFTSDSSGNGLGWFVDDIEISKAQSCTADVSYQSNTFADACSDGGAGNANGVIDAGEDITVRPVLKNTGSQGATGLTATLSTSTPGITVTGATVTYPDLAAGASSACNAPHLAFSVGTGVPCGTVISFSLHITAAAGGGPWDRTFTMTVGQPMAGNGTAFLDDFETAGSWPNWTVTTGPGPHTCGPFSRVNTTSQRPAGGSGYYALSDSDACGNGSATSTILTSPAIDTSNAAWTSVTLEYDIYYNYYNGDDATVQVFNGTSWVTVWKAGIEDINTHHTWDVSAQALGNAGFRVRFSYQNASYDYWYAVDNVKVSYTSPGGCATTSCTPVVTPPGEAAPGDTPATAQEWTGTTTTGWPAVSGASSYTLYYGLQADLPALLTSVADSCSKYSGPATSVATLTEDPSSKAGRFFWYLITAANGAGQGTAGNATAGPRVVNLKAGESCPP